MIPVSKDRQREISLKTKELITIRDVDGNPIKFETFMYNNDRFLHLRQMKRMKGKLYPVKDKGITFSANYVRPFHDALSEVRHRRNKDWSETIDIYHKNKDFLIKIMKYEDNESPVLEISDWIAKGSIYYPNTRFKIRNKRNNIKPLISSLEGEL